jgi:Zn-dependent membrane protease YugP
MILACFLIHVITLAYEFGSIRMSTQLKNTKFIDENQAKNAKKEFD